MHHLNKCDHKNEKKNGKALIDRASSLRCHTHLGIDTSSQKA